MSDIIKNCKITQSDAKVIQKYCDNKQDTEYVKNQKKYSSCMKLSGNYAYCPLKGDIMNVFKEGNKFSTIIRIDDIHYLKLGNLKECMVQEGDIVQNATPIGPVKDYVSVEYISTEKTHWQVRVGANDFYKNDPSDIVENGLDLYEDDRALRLKILTDYREGFIGYGTILNNPFCDDELSNGRGDG